MTSKINSFLNRASSNANVNKICDLIVSKEEGLLDSITQLYIIEGMSPPMHTSTLDCENIGEYSNERIKNVILDLRYIPESTQLVEVNQILTLLDVNITLFVLSDINSISLQNKIYNQGAVYVLWDKELNSLSMAILSQSNLSGKNLYAMRSAKRVLILGTKGGVGVSCVSSVLSSALSTHTGLKVLLVDHDANALSSDIYLGINNFKLKTNSLDLTQIEIDAVVAEGYVHRVQNKLDYLALDRSSIQVQQHTELLYQLSNELLGNYNFIIDSVPLSAFESLDLPDSVERYHRVFLICDPSVVSLRAHNVLIKSLGNVKYSVIFNLNRSPQDYLMSVSNAKERIRASEVNNIGYEVGLEKVLLKQGVKGLMEKKFSTAIARMIIDLTGKNIKPKSSFSLFKK